MAFIDVDDGIKEQDSRRYQDRMQAQPCLVAAGQFQELQTKVVRLCLQERDESPSGNTTLRSDSSALDAGRNATCSTAFKAPFGAFSDSWEPVLMPGDLYAGTLEALVVSSFS